MPSIIISRAPGMAFRRRPATRGANHLVDGSVNDEGRRLDPLQGLRAIARGEDRSELPRAGTRVEAAIEAAGGPLTDVLLVAVEAG
jgi:hypothetical protein